MREAPLIAYGGSEGPVFERLCPICARFMKFPDRLEWQTTFDDRAIFPKIECSRCGPVEPVHVGFRGDFEFEEALS